MGRRKDFDWFDTFHSCVGKQRTVVQPCGEKTNDCGTATCQETLLLGKCFWSWECQIQKRHERTFLPIFLLSTYSGKRSITASPAMKIAKLKCLTSSICTWADGKYLKMTGHYHQWHFQGGSYNSTSTAAMLCTALLPVVLYKRHLLLRDEHAKRKRLSGIAHNH